MNEHDLYYLRSILHNLRELHSSLDSSGPSLGGEALADNIDWLDCFINKWERAQERQKRNFRTAMERRSGM